MAAFTAAQKLAPDDARLISYLAQALLAARKNDRALAVTPKRSSEHPEDDAADPAALAGAGAASARVGEAIRFLEGAIKSESRSPELALALADAYASRRSVTTRPIKRRCSRPRPTFGEDDDVHDAPGELLRSRPGGCRMPSANCGQMIERDPLTPPPSTTSATCSPTAATGTPRRWTLIERALSVEPDNPSYLDSLGWALFKQGKRTRPSRSAGAPRRAAGQLGDPGSLRRCAPGAQGNWAEAIVAWQRALAGDGESIERAAIEKKIQDAGAGAARGGLLIALALSGRRRASCGASCRRARPVPATRRPTRSAHFARPRPSVRGPANADRGTWPVGTSRRRAAARAR